MTDLILLAHVPTASVNEGFLPAARRLGLSVVLLTDHAEAHQRCFAGMSPHPDEIVACDVFNPIAVVDCVSRRTTSPAAIFSNSDHLQASTAIAAQYFGRPGKDWQVAYRAKNKAAMRSFLQAQSIDTIWHAVITDEDGLESVTPGAPFPCVVKPHQGVGSRYVRLVRDCAELTDHCRAIWSDQPGLVLLLEEYIVGPLYTLETMGDGRRLHALGGFRVSLAPPPHFVEVEAHWGAWLSAEQEAAVLRQITAFGVGFGSCHTEFVLTDAGPRLIEINYRTVGDYRDFLLQDALEVPLFETILRLHMGEPLDSMALSSRAAAICYFPADRAGEVITAPPAFTQTGGGLRLGYLPLRQAGETVALTHSNKDYLGVLSASAPDAASLGQAMQAASKRLAWEIRP